MPPSDGGRLGDHPPNQKGRLAGIWRLSWQGGVAPRSTDPCSEIRAHRGHMAVILGSAVINERIVRRALVTIVLLGLVAGLLAYTRGDSPLAHWIWGASTVPVVVALAVSIARDLFRGRMGVDAIAFLSMIAALVLGQTLAGIVVAIMYAGGTVLEDFAVARAERSLKQLVDRAPRIAHRRSDQSVEDVPVDDIKIGDAILVRAGEVIPVDGLITSASAVIDEFGSHWRTDSGHAL